MGAAVPLNRLLKDFVSVAESVPITGLTEDSGRIQPGMAFFALAGAKRHGLSFALEAQAKGASVIIYEPEGGDIPKGASIPCIPVPRLREKLGEIASRFYGNPSESLEIIGITGTNGKTSCSFYLAQALEDCAVMGTLGWGRPDQLQPSQHTTPPALELQRRLAFFKENGVNAVAMEVSSHALSQGRVNGVKVDQAIWTNLSRDHLDYHGTLEDYLAAKQKMLAVPGLSVAVINVDDPAFSTFPQKTPIGVDLWGFSVEGKSAEFPVVRATEIDFLPTHIRFLATFESEQALVSAPLLGEFNLANLLAVLTLLRAQGISLTEGARRVQKIQPVPGRMECFGGGDAPLVVVDYAHTPAALGTALKSLRRHCQGNLWLVFGCGGERDRGKRPEMGQVAERYADQVIVTDDNPRGESEDQIIADILTGMVSKPLVIRDRAQAISQAITQATPKDVILVAGKGHEDYQEVNGQRLAFSDQVVVRQLIRGEAACV